MTSKLQKAQLQYEGLLRDLGSKAEMVGCLDQVDADILEAYQKAQEALSDRKLELELIEGEIESSRRAREQRAEELRQEIARLKSSIEKDAKTIGVKKGKLSKNIMLEPEDIIVVPSGFLF